MKLPDLPKGYRWDLSSMPVGSTQVFKLSLMRRRLLIFNQEVDYMFGLLEDMKTLQSWAEVRSIKLA